LSGDTDKQKLSVQKPWSLLRSNPRQEQVNLCMLNVQPQKWCCHTEVQRNRFTKNASVTRLIRELLFVYRHLSRHSPGRLRRRQRRVNFSDGGSPDRRKIISSLCELCASVVNPGHPWRKHCYARFSFSQSSKNCLSFRPPPNPPRPSAATTRCHGKIKGRGFWPMAWPTALAAMGFPMDRATSP
jgi:hypothetical protein